MVYISHGLSVTRSLCDPTELRVGLPDLSRGDDRSAILIRVVASGEPMVWADWRRWHEGVAATWGSALVDVLVVSPTQWDSLLLTADQEPSGRSGLEPRSVTPAR